MKLHVGCKITGADGDATLGCFVHKEKQLYATASAHAFKLNETVKCGAYAIGNVEARNTTDLLDAALIKVSDKYARGLKQTDFQIKRGRKTITLTRVLRQNKFDPALRLIAWHAGQKSQFVAMEMKLDTHNYTNQFGELRPADIEESNGFTYKHRHTRPGDSGGPLYLDDGTLIGFVGGGVGSNIKSNMGAGSENGFYRRASDVFENFKVELATWDNRGQWLPADDNDNNDNSDFHVDFDSLDWKSGV